MTTTTTFVRAAPRPLCHISLATPSLSEGQFAFARIKGNVCLVQLTHTLPGPTSSALSPLDVNIFRHEFITIFRFSHCETVHPADISIIEPIDAQLTRYEENGTVFLARETMGRLRKMTQNKVAMQKQRPSSIRYYSSPRWRTAS